jgi:hypothetical protein
VRPGYAESILIFASVLPLTLSLSPSRGEGRIRRFVIYTFFGTIGREDFEGY